jgi:hypothetical protein
MINDGWRLTRRFGLRGGELKWLFAWASFRNLVSFNPSGQLEEGRKRNDTRPS